MSYHLVEFDDNWADEMDIQGWILVRKKDKDKLLNALKEHFSNGAEVYFGTNESNRYESYEHFMTYVTITKVSADHRKIIKKHFGLSYGNTSALNCCF